MSGQGKRSHHPPPWKNGLYVNPKLMAFSHEVNVAAHSLSICSVSIYQTVPKLDYPDSSCIEAISTGTWTFGDFGPAKEEVTKASGGIKNYNVQIIAWSGISTLFNIKFEIKKSFNQFYMIKDRFTN